MDGLDPIAGESGIRTGLEGEGLAHDLPSDEIMGVVESISDLDDRSRRVVEISSSRCLGVV